MSDTEQTITVRAGEPFGVVLPGLSHAGYVWQFASGPAELRDSDWERLPTTRVVFGRSANQRFSFYGVTQDVTLRFEAKRSWLPDQVGGVHTAHIRVVETGTVKTPVVLEHHETRVDTGGWGIVSRCSCGDHWSHPLTRTTSEMDDIFKSHVRYYQKRTEVL